MRFVALDVETANPNLASICQIGVIHFEGPAVVDTWSVLVDPDDYFDGMNVAIHGIDAGAVRGAPKFADVFEELSRRLSGQTTAIHTGFDRVAILRAAARANLPAPACTWLNTASVARRAWPEVAKRGYGLAALCERFGIGLRHHDAAEDARAAGLILLKAIDDAGLDLDGWVERLKHPVSPEAFPGGRIAIDGNPDGPLHGEVVVFTGALSMPRQEAASAAAKAGCTVAPGVTKKTTLVVIGDGFVQGIEKPEKSAKHVKAEALIAQGIPIRLLTESDFAAMIGEGMG
jgi:DNA polymerase-3 subunit epsilon